MRFQHSHKRHFHISTLKTFQLEQRRNTATFTLSDHEQKFSRPMLNTSVPLPYWLPNETLFSLCSRNHSFLLNLSPRQTCNQLFGHPRQGMQHDLPSNVATFATRSNGVLGTATEIIHQHTILPFFAPFQSPERIQMAVNTMLGASVGGLKYRLGLVTGRFGAEHPLKACPQCMEEDVANLGVAYWHLDHQYPGVLVCTLHGSPLWESCLKRIWSGRFTWCLPDFDQLIAPNAGLNSELQPALRLAKACSELARLGLTQWLDFARLRRVYSVAILGEGNGHRCSAKLPNTAVTSLIRFAADLRPFRALQALPATSREAETFLHYLLRSPRSYGHPLRHLTTIVWLFESLENFLQAYGSEGSSGELEKDQLLTPPGRKNVKLASSTAQRKLGSPRPKTLKPSIRIKALHLLKKGANKRSVCRYTGVTLSTINKLLRAEPEIYQAWKAAFAERGCVRQRARWCSCAKAHPNSSPQQLRQLIPSTYAWLYRNDKGWLVEQIAGMPNGRQGNHRRVDWEMRDSELERHVHNAVEVARTTELDSRLSRSQLYALVPSLPTCLHVTEHYPRTRKLVQLILG